MKDRKKAIQFVITVLNALFIFAGAAGCLHILTVGCGTYYSISAGVELLAIAFSLLYYVYGYKKNAAKFYRLFMLFYAFTYLAEIFAGILDRDALGVDATVSYTILFSMILYGNTLIVAVGKDIGKTASYIIMGVNILFYALPVLALIPGLEILTFASKRIEAANVILYCVWLILALNAFLMCMAKYYDKAQRGTK